MQAEGKLPVGTPKKYPSAFAAYGIIARQEGVKGLWTGVGPNIGRNALINAAELASYDQVKQMLLHSGHFKDNEVTHILSGLGAGLVAVCVGSPVDVVKSRVMGDKVGQYNGMLDCFAKTYAKEGLPAFYKGFLPNFARLGSWNVVMFMSLEKVRAMSSTVVHPVQTPAHGAAADTMGCKCAATGRLTNLPRRHRSASCTLTTSTNRTRRVHTCKAEVTQRSMQTSMQHVCRPVTSPTCACVHTQSHEHHPSAATSLCKRLRYASSRL